MTTSPTPTPDRGPQHLDADGISHGLGRKPPTTANRNFRSTRVSFAEWLHTAGGNPAPPDKWQPIDLSKDTDPECVTNQFECSGCVGFSDAHAENVNTMLRGLPFPDLSGAYVYALINGGYDQGAAISDAARATESHGICKRSTMDYPHIYRQQTPADADNEAADHLTTPHLPASNFTELCQALQLGLVVQFAIEVGSNFGSFTADGVAGLAQGPGNHSVIGLGIRKLETGVWAIIMGNSWGKDWGPFRNGTCLVTRQHVDSVQQDAFVHADIRALT